MGNEDELKNEIERLKGEVLYEKVRAENLADRAAFEAKHQKEKSTEILAIALVLLICSVLIIFGLTGIIN